MKERRMKARWQKEEEEQVGKQQEGRIEKQ